MHVREALEHFARAALGRIIYRACVFALRWRFFNWICNELGDRAKRLFKLIIEWVINRISSAGRHRICHLQPHCQFFRRLSAFYSHHIVQWFAQHKVISLLNQYILLILQFFLHLCAVPTQWARCLIAGPAVFDGHLRKSTRKELHYLSALYGASLLNHRTSCSNPLIAVLCRHLPGVFFQLCKNLIFDHILIEVWAFHPYV